MGAGQLGVTEGKGGRSQDSGGKTTAVLTSVLPVLVPIQEKKRGVRQRYLPLLPARCLPGPAQAGYRRALGCIRALVTVSPLQPAEPSAFRHP